MHSGDFVLSTFIDDSSKCGSTRSAKFNAMLAEYTSSGLDDDTQPNRVPSEDYDDVPTEEVQSSSATDFLTEEALISPEASIHLYSRKKDSAKKDFFSGDLFSY